CSGPSMEPTIQNSDIVFSENLSRHFYCIRKYAPLLRLHFTSSIPYLEFSFVCVCFCFSPPRGDIVIVKSPTDPKSNICKRVIGLEGDKVCTSNPSDFLKTHCFVSIRLS
ncbi:hypothetical protein ASZ78_011010, partial [Callipepla squamata]